MMIASPATRSPLATSTTPSIFDNAPTTLAGCRFQLLRIVAEQLDLDRLRNGGQIADQILHQLGGFDLQARHLMLNLGPDLRHHLFDIAPIARTTDG